MSYDRNRGWWRAVAVTGAHADVTAVVAALRLRQAREASAGGGGSGGEGDLGITSATALVAAPDFAPPSAPPLGSGTATLNALLVLAEVHPLPALYPLCCSALVVVDLNVAPQTTTTTTTTIALVCPRGLQLC